jgi:peroxiredoxin
MKNILKNPWVFIILIAATNALAAGAVLHYLQAKQARMRASHSGERVSDFGLLDQNGRFHQLYRRKAKAVVLYVHGVGCPLVKNNWQDLKALQTEYAGRGVDFLMLNANPQDTREAVQQEASQLGIDLPVLKDPAQLVAESLHITRTGEALVLDPQDWTIRYRGPIDDRVNYEAQKAQASQHYLWDALDAVLDDDVPEIAKRPGPGCVISRLAGAQPAALNYVRDIAPILQQRCEQCHRAGGIGPWAMDGYARVKGWSAMMREVILNARMPPWHVDPAFGQFTPELGLSVDEQRTLVHWIEAGAPRGEGRDPLASNASKTSNDDWPLGPPDLLIDVPKQDLPATGNIPYRWIRIPSGLTEDRWVRAAYLKPSNRSAMHHGFVFVEYPNKFKELQPQWLEGLNGFFTAHVPGAAPMPFPENAGQWLPAGATLVLQLHYVANGRPGSDASKLAIYFHKQPPEQEYKVASAVNMQIRIPPRTAEHEEHAEMTMPETGVLQALYPHMHYRGSRFRFRARYPDGHEETLLSVPNYKNNWQTIYHLAAPKILPSGTQVLVDAAFDNSDLNPANPDPDKEVRWGLGDREEMLVGYFMYTRKRETPVPANPTPNPQATNGMDIKLR